jgi:hypothetical protein
MRLPQFCLSYIESRLVWLGFKPPLPARPARFSLARVIMFTAGQALVGALIGWLVALLLSALLFHSPLTWLVWVCMWFSMCQGLVCSCLTALCWNQRAARLQANPVLNTDLPPARFPIFRGLLGVVYFLLIALITPAAILLTIENVRGRFAWEQFKHAWEAKGERFDAASIIPPPVPDDQNFALTPLLRPVYDFVRGTNGTQWRDTNAYAHLNSIRAGQTPEGSTNTFPTMRNLEKGELVNLEAFQIFYRGNTNYPQPAIPGTPAQDVLTALGKFDADLNELSEAAEKRPNSRFPIHYDDKPSWDILLPHLAQIKGLCQIFQLRAIARLELRQTDAAFADLKTGFRLSDSIRDEPFLIDHLVRLATVNIGLQAVREGLVRHAWNDAQLAALEKNLASLNLLAEYKHAMRGERYCNISGLEFLAQSGFRKDYSGFMFMGEDGGAQKPRLIPMISNGWLYQNMIETARMHQQFLLPAVDEQQHRVFREIAEGQGKALTNQPTTPYNILTKMLVPALSGASKRSARTQTLVDEARVACALERYRRAHGQLPDTLDTLAPQFIEKIPNDVIDGKPLRYRKNSDGSYILYSIGWNQADDRGIVVLGKGSSPGVDPNKGDWVWRYPGV